MRYMVLLSILYGCTITSEDCSTGYNGTSCIHACMENCLTCFDQNTCTQCESGYFFNGRTCKKCRLKCLNCSAWDNCDVCKDGSYNGHFYDDKRYTERFNCTLTCHENCKSCTSYNNCKECKDPRLRNCKTCIANNSTCSACNKGKYGIYCINKCEKGCENQDCHFIYGTCNCSSNFQGERCEYCKHGFYGQNCETTCPFGCEACFRDGTCSRCKEGYTGINCESCKQGVYGKNCLLRCEKNCESCLIFRHHCVTCINGKYGVTEDIKGEKYISCHDNCSEYCIDKTCKTDTGECDYGCVQGHWSEKCNKRCPNNCKLGICFRNNGKCFHENVCDVNQFGHNCDKTCHSNCLGNREGRRCNVSNGHCFGSCPKEFFGDFCDRNCSETCKNTTCRKEDGNCISGCIEGYKGGKCDLRGETMLFVAFEQQESGLDIDPIIIIIIVATCTSAVLLVAGILLFKRCKRRRDNAKNSNNQKNYSDETAAVNIDQDTNHMDNVAETVGPTPDKPKRTSETAVAPYEMIAERNMKTEADKNTIDLEHHYANINTSDNEKTDSKTRNEVTPRSSNDDCVLREPLAVKYVRHKSNNDCIVHEPLAEKFVRHKSHNDFVVLEPLAGKYLRHKSYYAGAANIDTWADFKCLSRKTKSVGDIFINEIVQSKAEGLDTDDTYYNVIAVEERKITLDKFSDFVANKTTQDFDNEFQLLPKGLIKPYLHSQEKQNVSKNRYRGLYPYDATRVVLKEGDSDYINASYIDGYNKCRAYIASSGPSRQFMGDMSAFWIMVWQENVGKIVMLTKLVECGTVKCDQYWPEKDFSMTFANIQVTCKSEENFACYTMRSFDVQKDEERREFVHVHFTAWPDKRTPDDVISLAEFRQKVNGTKTSLTGPIIVHCRAGIGRTGTYIALDGVTNEGEVEGRVDIYAFVRNLREQRVNMVQTAEQYQYLHNALVHTLTFHSKAIETSKFLEYMETYNVDQIGRMFMENCVICNYFLSFFSKKNTKKLQATVELRSVDEHKAVEMNKALVHKNRDGADIPGDMYRPRLYMDRTSASLNYINAVYVNSYRCVDRYLVAQTPLPETVDDFLTLLVQERVSCIISMETDQLNDKTDGVYCPSRNQTLKKGAFKIRSEQGRETDTYKSKKLTISYKGKTWSQKIIIPEVRFKHWHNNQAVPDQPKTFVKFVNDVELNLGAATLNGPILVHCKTGTEKSGLFCVVSILMEKTTIDREFSVANTVRQIKHRRYSAIPSKEQYVFCHQCVNEYIQTFDGDTNHDSKAGK